MKTFQTIPLVSTVMLVMSLASSAMAQESFVIAYRLSDWKTMEFDNPTKAQQHLQAVKDLGCEARTENHEGHLDVTYRLPEWKPLELASDKLVHDWEGWLKSSGFETIHGHGDNYAQGHDGHNHAADDHTGHQHGPNGEESIAYRMPNWKTLHFETGSERDQLIAIAQGLGCEVRQESHAGHDDVLIRSPRWMHAEFPTHAIALNWEQWMKRTGFETQHEHGGEHNHVH